jgi:hypothetical protein
MSVLVSGRRVFGAMLVAMALLALPASALARDSFAIGPEVNVRLSLPGSHGYRISITNVDRKRRVILRARKGPFAALYAVHGRANGHRIEANFGKLGKVSVHFQPSSQNPEEHGAERGCKGKPTTVQRGRFVGTIRFEGEEGFSTVNASSAKGTIKTTPKRVCDIGARPGTPPTRRAALDDLAGRKGSALIDRDFLAANVHHNRSVFLWMINTSSQREAALSGFTVGEAAVTEARGRIKIARSAQIETDKSPVEASPIGAKTVTASIAIPGFQGTGSFSEAPGSPPSWTGDLSVELPGGGSVPLTGPAFTTSFCHGPLHEEKTETCEIQQSELVTRALHYPLYDQYF